MPLVRTLSALAVAATAVVLAPLPASAAPTHPTASPASTASGHPSVRVLRDTRHDVVELGAGAADGQPRPHRREGDLTAVRVRHGDHTVRIRVRFAELSRPGARSSAFVTATLRTPGEEFTTGAVVESLHPQGMTWIEDGGDFRCPGLTARVRYGREVLELRVPRRCLDDPAWVRVSTSALVGHRQAVWSDTVPGASLGSTRVGRRVWAPGA